jgi:hypothetical protein
MEVVGSDMEVIMLLHGSVIEKIWKRYGMDMELIWN